MPTSANANTPIGNFPPSALDQDDVNGDIPSAGAPVYLDDPHALIDALAAEALKNAQSGDSVRAIAAAASVLKNFLPLPL